MKSGLVWALNVTFSMKLGLVWAINVIYTKETSLDKNERRSSERNGKEGSGAHCLLPIPLRHSPCGFAVLFAPTKPPATQARRKHEETRYRLFSFSKITLDSKKIPFPEL